MNVGDCFTAKIPHMVISSIKNVIIVGFCQYKKDNLIVFAGISDIWYETYNIFNKEKFCEWYEFNEKITNEQRIKDIIK